MSLYSDVTDAVVVTLNGNDFGIQFEARRHYYARYILDEEGDKLQMPVVFNATTVARETRGLNRESIAVQIGLLRKLKKSPAVAGWREEIDSLAGLVDDLIEFLTAPAQAELTTGSGAGAKTAKYFGIEATVIADPEHLQSHNQFTAVLTVTYLVFR